MISIGISLKFHIAFCLFVSGPAIDDKHCFDCLLVVSTIDLLGPGRTVVLFNQSTYFGSLKTNSKASLENALVVILDMLFEHGIIFKAFIAMGTLVSNCHGMWQKVSQALQSKQSLLIGWPHPY